MVSAPAIRAVAGLGNPGPEYASTRHNVGFMVIDELARRGGLRLRSKFSGRFGQLIEGQTELLALAPQTWMNLSGDSVQPMCAFFRISASELLVVHDDIDLPFGELKIKIGGGHAGHNGLRSIISRMASADFLRLRVGVGRPEQATVRDHVLATFRGEERADLDKVIDAAADAVWQIARLGGRAAMNEVNGRRVV